jgi:hypothetical protein
MPTTANRGWTYPSLGQNPYFTTIEGLYAAQDADVAGLFARRYVGSNTATQGPVTGTTLAALATLSIPAGALNVTGAVLRARAGGQFTTNATGSIFLAVYLAGATGGYVFGSGTVSYPVLTNAEWMLEGMLTIRPSSTVYPGRSYVDMGEDYLRGYGRQASFTMDLSVGTSLQIQVQWPATGQFIVLQDFVIEVLRPGP